MPLPKLMCGDPTGSRVMSNVPGSGNTDGSKFAVARLVLMNVPFGKRTPSISMSSLAYLMVPFTAPQ